MIRRPPRSPPFPYTTLSRSSDGTASQTVTVTINGTNDVPVIGGVFTGSVTEDATTPNLTTGGLLSIADADQSRSTFAGQPGTTSTHIHSCFTLTADGSSSYT